MPPLGGSPTLHAAVSLQAAAPSTPAGGKAGGDPLAILRQSEQCASDQVFNAILSTTMTVSNDTENRHDIIMGSLFSLLLALGLGLLIAGGRFERASLAMSFALVLWLVTFLLVQVSGIIGRIQGLAAVADLPCDFALYCAFAVCAAITVVIYLLYCIFGLIRPVLDFITGFTLGAVGMLVVFCFIETASITGVDDVSQVGQTAHIERSSLGLLDPQARDLLYAYEGFSLFVAIAFGVFAIFFMPVVSKALRCAVGGLCTAVGCSGLYTLAHNGATMDALPYWGIMIGSAVAGFFWQSFTERPQHTKAEYAPTESSPLKR